MTQHGSKGPAAEGIRMHSWLLLLRPAYHEELYFSQLEVLDLLSCLIAPIFFAATLERWPRSFLTGVYTAVLGLKGYQMALLLLPSARAVHAHRRARYFLLFVERVLRQFVATPALGRGPHFIQWLTDTAAADPGPATAFKMTMLVSGVTHAFWNSFCLPLNILSQVFFNGVFFAIHFPPTVSQVAYSMALLVRRWHQLVWLQVGLECGGHSIWQLLQQPWQAAANAVLSSTTMTGAAAMPQQQCMQAAAAAALLPGRAPDLETPAGRLVLALSTAFMLLVVLYLPLYFSWRLERHLKSSFMSASLRGSHAAGQNLSSSGPSLPASKLDTPASSCSVSKGSTSTSNFLCDGFVQPPVVFPLLPNALAMHMVAAAAVCFLVAEWFVGLCSVSPLVAGVLWQQIPG